jgi:hypothetical protein
MKPQRGPSASTRALSRRGRPAANRISLRPYPLLDLLATLPGRALALVTLVVMALAMATLARAAEVPKPDIVIANPGHCIAPAEEMRRNHMEMLKHQRNLTMREGQRGAKVSLNGCIECHASKTNHSVLGREDNFCQACHSYMAVSIDCFECHQPKTGDVQVGAKLP